MIKSGDLISPRFSLTASVPNNSDVISEKILLSNGIGQPPSWESVDYSLNLTENDSILVLDVKIDAGVVTVSGFAKNKKCFFQVMRSNFNDAFDVTSRYEYCV